MKSNTNDIISNSSNKNLKYIQLSIKSNNFESNISDNNLSEEETQSSSFFDESSSSIDKSSEINSREKILNVMMDEKAKKFFVKLFGYEPIFFHVKNLSKKMNEIIEEYLKAIKVEINDKLKKTFSYKGKLINLNQAIKDLDHLSWITSDYIV